MDDLKSLCCWGQERVTREHLLLPSSQVYMSWSPGGVAIGTSYVSGMLQWTPEVVSQYLVLHTHTWELEWMISSLCG